MRPKLEIVRTVKMCAKAQGFFSMCVIDKVENEEACSKIEGSGNWRFAAMPLFCFVPLADGSCSCYLRHPRRKKTGEPDVGWARFSPVQNIKFSEMASCTPTKDFLHPKNDYVAQTRTLTLCAQVCSKLFFEAERCFS